MTGEIDVTLIMTRSVFACPTGSWQDVGLSNLVGHKVVVVTLSA